MLPLVGDAAASTVDWANIITIDKFNPIIENISAVMPVLITFSVAIIGIRFVWKFIKGQIKRP